MRRKDAPFIMPENTALPTGDISPDSSGSASGSAGSSSATSTADLPKLASGLPGIGDIIAAKWLQRCKEKQLQRGPAMSPMDEMGYFQAPVVTFTPGSGSDPSLPIVSANPMRIALILAHCGLPQWVLRASGADFANSDFATMDLAAGNMSLGTTGIWVYPYAPSNGGNRQGIALYPGSPPLEITQYSYGSLAQFSWYATIENNATLMSIEVILKSWN